MVAVSKPFDRIQRLKKRLGASVLLLCALVLCFRSIFVSSRATRQSHRRIDLLEKFPVANTTGFAIDILSVGTLLRGELQDAQERTFAADPSVRHWVRLNERNDYEEMCSSKMTSLQVKLFWQTCKETIWVRKVSQRMRGELFTMQNHTGWLCAQKRSIDGLYQMIDRYRTKREALPDYLMLLEDDTYMNTAKLASMLQSQYQNTDPNLLSGCLTYYPDKQHIAYPEKGSGTIISRVAIQNMLRPIYCEETTSTDLFSINACWRLRMNIMGEQSFFQEGMTLIDIMVEYSRGFEFAQVSAWKARTGFCLTSESALGFFLAFYNIGVPEGVLKDTPNDFMRKKYGFQSVTTNGRCDNSKCSPDSLVCHGLTAKEMDTVHAASKK